MDPTPLTEGNPQPPGDRELGGATAEPDVERQNGTPAAARPTEDLMTDPSPGERFRALHASGTFVVANPFDVGSARVAERLGYPALATSSAGFAWSRGHQDGGIDRKDLLDHVHELTCAVDIPVHVDAEDGFGATPDDVARTVTLLARSGAAGCSIEDWDGHAIRHRDDAVERVRAAADAAHRAGIVLTARCEHHIRGVDDLDATFDRLTAYQDAGAEVVYAPGLTDLDRIHELADHVNVPVNVLLLPGGPSVADLERAGVRRVSVGSGFATAAYGAFDGGHPR